MRTGGNFCGGGELVSRRRHEAWACLVALIWLGRSDPAFVGELGWIVEGLCGLIEGLCSVVEGLCRLFEGLCSAVFAVSALIAVLAGWNLKYFGFPCDFSRKKRKSAAETSVRSREIRWLEEVAGRMLTSILSISELWMRQLEAFF